MKKTKTIYWIATILFAGLMIFSAVGGIKPNEETIKILHEGLGYPIYFIQFISIAKLIGSIAILIFDLAGAVYSGVAISGAFDPMMLTLLAWIVPGIVSYIYFHKLKAE